jgi:hypothetical protein
LCAGFNPPIEYLGRLGIPIDYLNVISESVIVVQVDNQHASSEQMKSNDKLWLSLVFISAGQE